MANPRPVVTADVPIEIDTDGAAATRRAKDRDEVTAVWVGTADDPELAEFKAEVGYRR